MAQNLGLTTPGQAQIFTSPREAWKTAIELRESQAEYLDRSAVELHIREADDPGVTRQVTSLAQADNRPALRAHWRRGFREALPPDLPSPLGEPAELKHRLADYLRDVDWDALRARHESPGTMSKALDPGFWLALSHLAARDYQVANDLLEQHAPRDLVDQVRADWQRPGTVVDEPAGAGPSQHHSTDVINEIVRDRSREQEESALSSVPREAGEGRGVASPAREQDQPLPAFVRRHFVRAGDQFYYRQKPDTLAFSRRGETIRAHDDTVSLATAMVELAGSRGWSALKVRGSRDFRRMVWAAAVKRGLSVDGYTPSAAERAILDRESEGRQNRMSERAESRTAGRERDRPADTLAGVLSDHGPAPYRHEAGNSPSYFVSLRAPSGEVVTHWGLDLKRATEEACAEVGDQVRLARLSRQRVQIQEPARDQQGNVVDHVTRETERNNWSVTVLSRSDRSGDAERRPRTEPRADPVAAKVVELFTAEHLGRLPPEDQARFRELYDQAQARLDSREIPTRDREDRPGRNVVSRDRHRERAAQGR
jgi:hypothetical protein